MIYNIIQCDLLKSGAHVIVHQTNCMGIMGSGVARQIRNKYPEVFLEYHNAVKTLKGNCLGGCLVCQVKNEPLRIANLFGQYYYRGFKDDDQYLFDESWKQPELTQECEAIRFTNYEAFYRGLVRLKGELRENETVIAFPYKIGCDRGGGSWEVIESMIKTVFNNTNKNIVICKL